MMTSYRNAIDRRSFLKTAAPFALGLATIGRRQIPIERGRFNENDIPLARERLLEMVNSERRQAGLNSLLLDDLACKVASEHAQEVPPINGHRKTILFPRHTHAGFGIAMQDRSVRLDELYLAKYVKIDPLPHQAKPKTTIVLRGHLNLNHFLNGVEVFYEPLPSPPDIGWLRERRSYGMPEPTDRLLPQLPERLSYPDGSKGSIEIDSSNRFHVRVRLAKQPGINTLMVWIKTGLPGIAFPAAQVCIRVE